VNGSVTSAKRKPRRHATKTSPAERGAPSTASQRKLWTLVETLDEGPDAAFRDILARIARGGRIRGHAF
jgi:hypothetical protein